MNLPLNIPYLLSRLRPNAKYVMNGRAYGDIVWLDDNERQPTLLELENEFLRIQGLESEHKDKTAKIAAIDKLSVHEKIEKAKAQALIQKAGFDTLLSDELTRINRDVALKKAAILEEIRLVRESKLLELETMSKALREALIQELAKAHYEMLEGDTTIAYQKLVGKSEDRKKAFPKKEEMKKAMAGGHEDVKKLARKMRKGNGD